jgi:hypothetical protein
MRRQRQSLISLAVRPESLQKGNRQFKSDKEDAARRKAEVKSLKNAVEGMKKGGVVKRSRGDGIAQRGKTKGRMC